MIDWKENSELSVCGWMLIYFSRTNTEQPSPARLKLFSKLGIEEVVSHSKEE